jgi:hypothetical protein
MLSEVQRLVRPHPFNFHFHYWHKADVPLASTNVRCWDQRAWFGNEATSAFDRFCSLIPGLGVKLSMIILAGPTVLSAVGVSPPHDGVR